MTFPSGESHVCRVSLAFARKGTVNLEATFCSEMGALQRPVLSPATYAEKRSPGYQGSGWDFRACGSLEVNVEDLSFSQAACRRAVFFSLFFPVNIERVPEFSKFLVVLALSMRRVTFRMLLE